MSAARKQVAEATPRYAIGIDLGTTHSALSYVDLDASDGETTAHGVLPVPQLTAPGTVEAQPLLPSFLYLPHADELPAGELALPWPTDGRTVVGELARSRGATTPIRLVSSAKSWLCHPGVDRRAAILPHERRPRWRASRRWRRPSATSSTCATPGTTRIPKPPSPSRT